MTDADINDIYCSINYSKNTEPIIERLYDLVICTDVFSDEDIAKLAELKEIICDFENEKNTKLIKAVICKINETIERNLSDKTDSNTTIDEEIGTERTDTDTVLFENIKILEDAAEIFHELIDMEELADDRIGHIFNDSRCDVVNGSLKDKNNKYCLDSFGLVIRRKSKNKSKDVYGWKFDSQRRPVHYHTQAMCGFNENVNNVLNIQYATNSKIFKPKGIIYKIYTKNYAERLKKFIIVERVADVKTD